VVWGSGILARLMNRFGWIIWLGGGVLGYVAGEMILKDRIVHHWIGAAAAGLLHYALPIGLGVVVTVLGWWFAQGHRQGKVSEHAT
jgi:predicted tellurium resistance membrane protein TerC